METLDISERQQAGILASGQQQPLSLMTINLNPSRKEDQLIIRILEASERKKKLIKKLLSPEEYESITFDQHCSNLDTAHRSIQKVEKGQKTVDAETTQKEYLNEQQSFVRDSERLGSRVPQKTCNDLQSNLAKKREALEFFFKEQAAPSVKQDNLAIELRSGYYLNSLARQQPEASDKNLIRTQAFNLMDRLVGLLGYVGISCSCSTSREKGILCDQSDRLCNGIKTFEPYGRERNLDIMMSRLDADGHLHKIIERGGDKQGESKLSNLIDLAKMHENHVVSFESLSSRLKLVQPVGHFNTIQLVGPQQFTVTKSQIELIVVEPSAPPLKSLLGERPRQRRDISKLVSNSSDSSRRMKLRLSKLAITNHKLMLAEERTALRIIDHLIPEEKSLHLQRNNLLDEFNRCIKLCGQEAKDSLDNRLLELKRISGAILGVCKQLLATQQEILVCASEIESLRQEQKFSSTSIEIRDGKSDSSLSLQTTRYAIRELANIIKTKSNLSQSSSDLLNFFSRHLEEYERCVGNERIINVELRNLNDYWTPTNKCPGEEVQRRRQVQDWLNSLRLKLLVGDAYFYECKPNTKCSTSCLFLYRFDRELNIPSRMKGILDMKIELSRTARLMPLRLHLEATANIQFSVDAIRLHQVTLQFNDETSLAQLELESFGAVLSSSVLQSHRLIVQRCKSDILLNNLYSKIFKANQAIDYSAEMKFARLVNKCDTSILIQLLGYKSRKHQRLELDPFIDYLDDCSNYGLQEHSTYLSTRQALLMWRWMNNMQQLVYLSERENIKNHSLQLDEFEANLELLIVQKRDQSGYRLIEQSRACAVQYIKEYEAQLKEILKHKANSERSSQHSSSTKLKEILSEPELKVAMDLSAVVRTARSFVPKRSARRPLLPKRREASGLKSAPLSFGPDLVHPPSIDAEAATQVDFQSNWQRLIASRLQLVVTVQQATNLPMRVMQAQPVSPSPRPTSPFISASPAASFMTQLIQPATPVQYLVPPTTYVEIVFQRRQQASSLAQGKSPAWNETLFFPVDVAVPAAINEGALPVGGSKDQLVDEFLQLNLYDYHCYLQDGIEAQQELSTLLVSDGFDYPSQVSGDMNSGAAGHPNDSSVIRAQRMQSTRQRVERHLLGSLRVPLSTLMTSGRIEGSFALKQPLLLENYQFEPEIPMLSNDMLMRAASPTPQNANAAGLRRRNPPETHISLFITLDPPVSMPIHLLHLPTGSHESDPVLELARLWELVVVHHRQRATTSNTQSAGSRPFARTRHSGGGGGGHRLRQSRHVRALVLQRDAKYCLISRLLVPLRPPAELSEQQQVGPADGVKSESNKKQDAMMALARFVALLSPLKYGLFGMRLLASSLWFDSAQLIGEQLGGPEEKAVLLCNYFLHIGVSSALLLGDAVPEGRCVYVIAWHEQSRFINDQLQLQAATLLESINTSAGDSSRPNLAAELSASRPIDRNDFISRLPIQMNAQSVQLWDPNSGKSYPLSAQIPLISVGSIVTLENVYANIQSVENPSQTNYDIRLKHFWFPLFESASSTSTTRGGISSASSLARGLASSAKHNAHTSWRRQLLQLEVMRKSVERPLIESILSSDTSLDYSKFSSEECNELKEAIERAVKSHLLKWRPDRPTYFNRTLSRLLADKLASFENDLDWRSELADVIKNEVLMAHLSTSTGLNTRQVISCPINLPYTSMKTIVDSIFASSVHNADVMLESNYYQQSNTSTQFLVACHVHPYPARVMSVWLYVAAIMPNTKGLSRLLMA